ncbi:SRPBCC family protein [Enterovibrio paralichthyis]|uniref:SRPBCC family protein n=1 Tax=Enterovibrio paralichthyis TaxID=2853805 RepID=UPI001C449963|nr:SRPBCC domain-containing protein [Enterovibrio paralichthyis]
MTEDFQAGYRALNLKKTYPVPAKKVFAAWTNPDVLACWFGPSTHSVVEVSIDAQVGGKYRIVLEDEDGNVIDHFGEYVLVSPYNHLVFTWMLEDQRCGGCEGQEARTLVSIDIEDFGDSSLLRLRHEHLPNEVAYQGHQTGWEATLRALELYLSA